MKICHLTDELALGGLEKTILAIALNLKDREHRIWCLKRNGPLAPEAERAGIVVREFGFLGAMGPGPLSRLTTAMRRERFDVVHCHGLYPSIWGRLAALCAGVPVRIAHAQSLYCGLSLRDRIKLRLLSPVTSRIIAVSEAVRKSLVECVRIDPKIITVIYNASEDMAARSSCPRAQMRMALGIGGDDTVALAIGRVEELKGHLLLLDAVARCRKQGARVTSLIVGDGPYLGELRHRAEILGLGAAAIFTGARTDIADILLAGDIVVQPSILREGLPVVLAEAASASRPLIATDIGGNPEIVDDGINGYIVPPGDAEALAEKIFSLAGDRETAGKMGEASRRIWQERFTIDAMARRVGGLYEELKGAAQ